MNYKKGDIAIVKFPFILKEKTEKYKGRPALVICDDKVERRYKDVTLAAITSQVPDETMDLELIIGPTKSNGLVKRSLLRLDFIMTIPNELISRKIGVLSEDLMNEVESRLKKSFGINTI